MRGGKVVIAKGLIVATREKKMLRFEMAAQKVELTAGRMIEEARRREGRTGVVDGRDGEGTPPVLEVRQEQHLDRQTTARCMEPLSSCG